MAFICRPEPLWALPPSDEFKSEASRADVTRTGFVLTPHMALKIWKFIRYSLVPRNSENQRIRCIDHCGESHCLMKHQTSYIQLQFVSKFGSKIVSKFGWKFVSIFGSKYWHRKIKASFDASRFSANWSIRWLRFRWIGLFGEWNFSMTQIFGELEFSANRNFRQTEIGISDDIQRIIDFIWSHFISMIFFYIFRKKIGRKFSKKMDENFLKKKSYFYIPVMVFMLLVMFSSCSHIC